MNRGLFKSIGHLSFVFVFVFTIVQGQSQPIGSPFSGVLLDYNTKAPVPYANIVVEGSNIGTSSFDTGIFYLPSSLDSSTYLKISSIGYSTARLRLDSLHSRDSVVIFLKPAIIRLDEVIVEAKRLSAVDFVREAIHSADKHAYPDDYVLEWYSTIVSTDSVTGLYYSQETVFDDYQIGNQKKRTIRQQREIGMSPKIVANPNDTRCALVPWFELGVADIKNAEYGVLSLKNINSFSFTYEGVVGLDHDSVYVIRYEAISHRYQVTGITNRKASYHGRLYIATGSYAILRHTLEVGEERPTNYEVLYKRIGKYYFPYYVKKTGHLNFDKKFKPCISNIYILRNATLHDVSYKAGYNWCDNRAPYDKDFWNANYPK